VRYNVGLVDDCYDRLVSRCIIGMRSMVLHGWGIYSENGERISAEYKKMEFGEGPCYTEAE